MSTALDVTFWMCAFLIYKHKKTHFYCWFCSFRTTTIGVCVLSSLFWLWQGHWEEETRVDQRMRWFTCVFNLPATWGRLYILHGHFSSQVLMRALRDFNTPKIVTEDVTIFLGLLGDLFPGLEVERERDCEFEKAIRKTTLELRLQPEETFILKVWLEMVYIWSVFKTRMK